MKILKSLIGLSVIVAGAGIVTFQSCTRNPCNKLVCQNGGVCTDNFCQCPTGYEGAQCETESATKFLGKYIGTTTTDSDGVTLPTVNDTVTIALFQKPNKLMVIFDSTSTTTSDTFYGVASGYTASFPDSINDSAHYFRHVNATIDNGLLNFYIETRNDSSVTKKVSLFTGRYTN